MDGRAAAGILEIPESFVPNAEVKSLLRTDGYAAVERSIKENSVRNAEIRSLQESFYIGVINAAGNRKIRRIRRNFVRSAEILLMRMISNDKGRERDTYVRTGNKL